MSSGGKDSNLALDRARRQGLDVRYLVNIYDGPSGRVAFHGVRSTLIAAQAEACGLETVTASTGPDEKYEQVFLQTLDTLKDRGVAGVIFGNIHLADVRAWYETRTTGAGLEHVEPLWGEPPMQLLREVIERGFRGTIVSVDLEQGAADLLGKEFDLELVTLIERLDSVDPCGEHGEYHSFVHDGPTFTTPVAVVPGETVEHKGHRLLDLTLATP